MSFKAWTCCSLNAYKIIRARVLIIIKIFVLRLKTCELTAFKIVYYPTNIVLEERIDFGLLLKVFDLRA